MNVIKTFKLINLNFLELVDNMQVYHDNRAFDAHV